MGQSCIFEVVNEANECLKSNTDLKHKEMPFQAIDSRISDSGQVILICPITDCNVELEVFANNGSEAGVVTVDSINPAAAQVSAFICKQNRRLAQH